MTTNVLLLIALVWFALAFGIGVIVGRAVRLADRREQPAADDFPDDPRDIDGL